MMRIATFSNNYYVKSCGLRDFSSRNDCWRSGSVAELLLSILSYLKLPYQLIPYDQIPPMGQLVNGSWRGGLYEELENGSIDLIANFWVESELRRRNFDFSFPVTQDHLVFYVKEGDLDLAGSLWLVGKVYTVHVWACIATCSTLILSLLLLDAFRQKKIVNLLQSGFEYVSGRSRLWAKLLWCTLGLSSLILVNLYSGALLARTLHPPKRVGVKDQWDMLDRIARKEMRLLLHMPDDFVNQHIQHSDHPFFQKFREVLEDNQPVIEPDDDRREALFDQGGFASVAESKQIYFCPQKNIHVIEGKLLPVFTQSFMFPRNSSYLKKFNRALIALQGHKEIILEKNYEDYLRDRAKWCTDNFKSEEPVPPLEMATVSGAFLIWMLLLALATCWLVAEIWSKTRSRNFVQVIISDIVENLQHKNSDVIPKIDNYTRDL